MSEHINFNARNCSICGESHPDSIVGCPSGADRLSGNHTTTATLVGTGPTFTMNEKITGSTLATLQPSIPVFAGGYKMGKGDSYFIFNLRHRPSLWYRFWVRWTLGWVWVGGGGE